MTDMAIPAKGRVLGPKSKLNGSLLRGKQTLLEEMANDSEARLDNLGIELGTGPMLGRDPCWGQEDSRGEMPAQQGRRRWWLTGSSVAPRTDPSASHPAPGGGFTAGPALQLPEAAPSTAWRALGSCWHKHQRALKTFFQTLWFSQ